MSTEATVVYLVLGKRKKLHLGSRIGRGEVMTLEADNVDAVTKRDRRELSRDEALAWTGLTCGRCFPRGGLKSEMPG